MKWKRFIIGLRGLSGVRNNIILKKVLIIDDEEKLRSLLTKIIILEGFDVLHTVKSILISFYYSKMLKNWHTLNVAF